MHIEAIMTSRTFDAAFGLGLVTSEEVRQWVEEAPSIVDVFSDLQARIKRATA